MNPLTNVRNITKLSERELRGADGKSSWHDEYRDSAWLFIGGLPFELSEGDIIAVFSQYGEPVNLNLVRHKDTGKSRGFAFLCYEDQRSTVLAVDNFNGTKILGRTIRVDHVKDYKPPKDSDKLDDITRQLHIQGCGPGVQLPIPEKPSLHQRDREEDFDDDRLQPPLPFVEDRSERDLKPTIKRESFTSKPTDPNVRVRSRDEESTSVSTKKVKKMKKKEKKSKKSKKPKKSRRRETSSSSSDSSSDSSDDEEPQRSRKRR